MRRVSNKRMSSHKTGHKMGFMVEERIRTGNMANGIESIHNWQRTVSNFSSLFGTKLRRCHYKVDKHVSYICAKLARSLFCLKRASKKLSQKSLKSLYHALIHPYLLYCINIMSCTSAKNLNRISKMPKKL